MKKSLKNAISALLLTTLVGVAALSASSSYAGDGDYKIKTKIVDNTTGTTIKIKEKGSYGWGGYRHVDKLKIKVKTPNGKFKVVANGVDYYPSVYNNGYWELPMHQVMTGFELVNLGDVDCLFDGVYMDALDMIVGASVYGRGGIFGSLPEHELRAILSTLEGLAQFSTLEDNILFLQPIRVLAGRATAVAAGRGDASRRTGDAMAALIAQIELAHNYFNDQMKVPAAFDWVVALLSHKERLSDIID